MSSIDLVLQINSSKYSDISIETKNQIPLLYKKCFDEFYEKNPSKQLEKLRDEYELKFNEYNNEILKCIVENENETKKCTVETKNENENENESFFDKLVKFFKNDSENKPVCAKFQNPILNLSEFQKRASDPNFTGLLLSCTVCLHNEEQHKVCSYFWPMKNHETVCSGCGCCSSKHNVCENFRIRQDCINFNKCDARCDHCGIYHYMHKKIINQQKFPCDHFKNYGAGICNCTFDHLDHSSSISFNLLPEKLQKIIFNNYRFIVSNAYDCTFEDKISLLLYRFVSSLIYVDFKKLKEIEIAQDKIVFR